MGGGAGTADRVAVRWSGRLACGGHKPSPRFGHTATDVGGGRVLVLGGWDGRRFPKDAHCALDALDARATEWHRLPEGGGLFRRVGHSAVLLPKGLAGALRAAGWDPEPLLKRNSACGDPCLAVFGGKVPAEEARGGEEDDEGGRGPHQKLTNDLFLLPVAPHGQAVASARGAGTKRG